MKTAKPTDIPMDSRLSIHDAWDQMRARGIDPTTVRLVPIDFDQPEGVPELTPEEKWGEPLHLMGSPYQVPADGRRRFENGKSRTYISIEFGPEFDNPYLKSWLSVVREGGSVTAEVEEMPSGGARVNLFANPASTKG